MSSGEEEDVAATESSTQHSSEDTFKILVATDNHLGFAEKNPVRGQDTFVTFEEILQLAIKHQVDFILLGGDLFHENRPSPYCTHKCIELLRKYCLNDNPVSFEFLSDQSHNFQQQTMPVVNYEDPNLNIGLPVFSIHGNHDDPTGHKHISALDIVASTGLINYFGRWNDLSQVEIQPILLQKGKTKLALYGLSHIRDERLGRLFRDKKVHMLKPNGDDWFNLLVLHQNRVARSVKNFIPDSSLPSFLHLVIWGHEHDCRIEPESTVNDVFISQPGSSVATSLSEGEAFPKKVGLLYVNKQEFKLTPISLKTVRPFLMDELILEKPGSDNYYIEKPGDQAIEQVKEKIENMIAQAASRHTNPNVAPPIPLLRLKVFYYSEQQQFNTVRIGMLFNNRVANPDEIIKLNTLVSRERKKKSSLLLDEDEFEQFVNVQEWATSVEDVLLKYCENNDAKRMSVLSAKGLTEAVTRFVKYSDTDSMELEIEKQYKKNIKQLQEMDVNLNNIEESIELLRDTREENTQASQNDEVIVPGESSTYQLRQKNISSTSTSRSKQKNTCQCGAAEDVIELSDDNEDNLIVPKEEPNASIEDVLSSPNKNKESQSRTSTRATRARGRGAQNRGTRTRSSRKVSNYSTLDSFCK